MVANMRPRVALGVSRRLTTKEGIRGIERKREESE